MIIAVTTWNGGVSPVFDVSQKLELFEVKSGIVRNLKTLSIPPLNSVDKVTFLLDHGVGVLICGALTRPTEKIILNHDLELHPFICGKIDTVISAWQQKKLIPKFKMPGCRRRRYTGNGSHCCHRDGPFQNEEIKPNKLIK